MAMRIASAARISVERCGRVVADTETGASSSSENGFSSPPVSDSRPPSWIRS